MLRLAGCPRCPGDLFTDDGPGWSDWVCLACGYRVEVHPAPALLPLPPRRMSVPGPSGRAIARYRDRQRDSMERDWRAMPRPDFLIKWDLNPSKWSRTQARWRRRDSLDGGTEAQLIDYLTTP